MVGTGCREARDLGEGMGGVARPLPVPFVGFVEEGAPLGFEGVRRTGISFVV